MLLHYVKSRRIDATEEPVALLGPWPILANICQAEVAIIVTGGRGRGAAVPKRSTGGIIAP